MELFDVIGYAIVGGIAMLLMSWGFVGKPITGIYRTVISKDLNLSKTFNKKLPHPKYCCDDCGKYLGTEYYKVNNERYKKDKEQFEKDIELLKFKS